MKNDEKRVFIPISQNIRRLRSAIDAGVQGGILRAAAIEAIILRREGAKS